MRMKRIGLILLVFAVIASFLGCPETRNRTPKFTVTFDINGGTGEIPTAQTVDRGSSITLPAGTGMSKSGFTFDGWNTSAEGTGTNYNAGDEYTVSENIRLYAKWIVVGTPMTITFNINGGTGTAPSEMTRNSGTSIILPDSTGFSKESYIFSGWNTNADGTGTNYNAQTSYLVEGNFTLYAKWVLAGIVYTVTFDINGGTGVDPVEMTGEYDSNISLPDNTGFSRDDYTFAGWNTSADGEGTNYDADDEYTIIEDITLYASWTAAITFDINDGTGTAPEPQTANADADITLPSDTGFSRDGFTFAGWSTVAIDGEVTPAGGEYTVTGTVTLYARWTGNVTFDRNGATGTNPVSQMANAGTSITLHDNTGFSREGFTFAGWNTSADGAGTNYEAGDEYPVRNITLYASWTATITFDINDGTGTAPEPQIANAGIKIILPNNEEFSLENNVFSGWSISTTDETILNAGAEYTVTGNITLYARWTIPGVECTITFHINNGSGTAPSQQTAFSGENITLPQSTGLSRDGYSFAGWNTSDDGTGANSDAGDSYTVTTSTTLYAKWTAQIAFDLNDGTGTAPDIRTENAGATFLLPDNTEFSRDGFTFAGWSINATGGDILNANSSYAVTGNVTLYARWTATVSFDRNGASGTNPTNQTANAGDSITLPAALTRDGHTFAGWNTSAAGTGDNFDANTLYVVAGNITLYAKWTTTVSFDTNGATTGTNPNPQTVNAGANITLPAGANLSRDGWEFTGWSINADGSGANYDASTPYTVTGNITLYARWSRTVTFNTNGGGTAPPALQAHANGANNNNPIITLPASTGLTRNNWTFTGWNANANGSELNYDANASYTVTSSTILYARWTRTVTFSVNGGTGAVAAIERHANGTSNIDPAITLPATLTRDGYTFTGWNTNVDGTGDNFDASSGYTITQNITLYAKWTATVSFNINNGDGDAPPNQTANAGASITLPDNSDFSRDGFTFAGWNINAAGTGTNYDADSEYTIIGNITLYARWTATITFDINDGTGTAPEPQTANAGANITLPSNSEFSKDGFTFAGWSTVTIDGEVSPAGGEYTVTGTVTLYARWTGNVTFNRNEATGTNPLSQMANAGASIILPDDTGFSRDGFTFAGWNTNAAGTGENFDAGGEYTVTGNVTLYARWTATVSFDVDETGATPEPQTANAGATIMLPSGTELSKTGHVFIGWSISATDETILSASSQYIVTGNITLYARWAETGSAAIIIFNINGATSGTAPQQESAYSGESITLPQSTGLSRTGYTFAGWNTSADGTGANFNAEASYIVIGSITLYARWTAQITFDLNDGTGTAPDIRTENAGAAFLLPDSTGFFRDGFTFAGWSISATGGAILSANSSYTVTGNATLYARWTATVSFNRNGAGGTNPASETVNAGTIITLPAALTRDGFTFAGWNTSDDGTGTNFDAGALYTVNGNITLYARWTGVVTFNANGGGTNPTSEAANAGTNITLPAGTNLSRDGWTFTGWNINANGSGDNYPASTSYTVNGNITLHARWSRTVTLNANGGGTNPAAINVHANGTNNTNPTTTLPASTGLARTGWTFTGWNASADGSGTHYNASTSYTVTGDSTLYARWTRTLTFSSNGGTGTIAAIERHANGANTTNPTVTLPAGFTRNGYTFAGWSTDTTGGTILGVGSSYTLTAATTTLNARWTGTVSFNLNSGTGTIPTAQTPAIGSNTITLPAGTGFTRDGFTFAGWSTDITDGTILGANSSYTVDGNITLYARWTGTVSFNSNGGEGTTPGNLTPALGSNTVTLPVGTGLTRTGFTFAGWNTLANGDGTNYNASASYAADGNITLYARWTATVSFDRNGGNGTTNPTALSANAGGSITLPAAITKDGFTFAGWNTLANGSGTNYDAEASYDIPSTGSITLYAKWTAIVSFDRNGAGGTTAALIGNAGDSITLPANAGTRTGFTFAGWNTLANGLGTNYDANTSYEIPVTGNITLFARWTATVSFDRNGGDGSTNPTALSANAGGSINLPAAITRAGFTFAGWNTLANGDGTNYNAGTSYNIPSTGNITLYARWTATVSFDRNGGDGSTNPDSLSGSAGGSITLPAAITRAGWTFTGWNTLANGDGTNYNAGASYTIPSTGNITLYARWSRTVTFNGNGSTGGTAPDSQTVHAGGSATITLPTTAGFTRTGFTFAGWSATATGAVLTSPYTVPNAASSTLYAIWNATVSFDRNGAGGTNPTALSGSAGATITLPAAITRTGGWEFTGWNTNANGSGTNYEAGASYTIPSTGDITLFARWTRTVTFNGNGSTGGSAPDSQTVHAGGSTTITLPAGTGLARDGFTFAGWSATATGAAVSSPYTVPNAASTTLYAIWNATVSFDRNGGGTTNPASQTGNAGNTITLPAAITRTGWTFTGWNTNANGSGTNYDASASYTIPATGNITLYARWTRTVTFNGNGSTDGTAPDSQIVHAGGSTTIALPTTAGFTRPNFTFVGWSATTTGTTALTSPYTVPNAASTTLYAIWNATVSFDRNGGSGTTNPASQSGSAGATITLPTAITRTGGWTFTGWNTNNNGSGTNYDASASYTIPATGNITLYARWTRTVTFNGNGSTGGTAPDALSVHAGGSTTITLPTTAGFTRPNFTFIGWSTTTTGTTALTSPYTVPNAASTTLYAIWNATVSFDRNGAGGTNPTALSGSAGATITLPAAITRTGGWEFTGWNTNANGSGDNYTAGTSYTIPATGNITLFARWSRTVTFNGNGSTGGTAPGNETVHAGGSTTITLPTTAGFTRPNFTFVGWSTTTTGTTALTSPYTVPNAASTTLYAIWNATVSFDRNGATGTTPSQTGIAGATINLPAAITRTGWTFTGWNTNANGSGTNYDASASYTIPSTGNITLFARWTRTVTFNGNGSTGGTAPDALSVHAGGSTTITLPTTAGFTRTGFTFAGWSATATGTVLTSPYTVPNAASTTLYAIWNATVSFDRNGATGTTDPLSANAGGSITLPASAGTRANWTFAGWNTQANGLGTNYAASASYTVNGNITLYARWSRTVTFNGNGSTGGTAPTAEVVYANGTSNTATITLPAAGFTRTGFTFAGWSATQTGTVLTSPYTVPNSASTTLYAIWNATVSFNRNGGGGTDPTALSGSAGGSITLPTYTGTRTGWTFDGWNTNANGSGDNYTVSTSYNIPSTGNITLYARWSKTVTFNGNSSTGGTAPAAQTVYANGTSTTVPSFNLPAAGTLARTNWTFAGWNTDANGSTGTNYAAGASYTPPAATSTTLYARWSRTVTFNGNSSTGGTAPAAQTVYANGTSNTAPNITLPAVGTLARTNWAFAGWNTDTNGSTGTNYATSASFAPTAASTTLYARWSRTVTFNGNSSTGGTAPAAQTVYANGTSNTASNITLPAVGTLVRTNWGFAGWNTDTNGSTGTNYAASASFAPTAASTTLYARWSRTVTFNGNGNTGGTAPANQVVYANGASNTSPSFNLPAVGTLVRTNFTFEGWSTATTGGTVLAAGSSYTPPAAASTTLNARWTAASTSTPVTGTWEGFAIPTTTTASLHSTYQGRTNVIQLSNDTNWSVLSYSLADYVGKEITISLSYDVWVNPSAAVAWQINSTGYPTVAGGTTALTANTWISRSGEHTLTPETGNVLYLSQEQLGTASAYFSNVVLTITETPTSNLPASFAGFTVPDATTATPHSSYQGRNNVLQVTGTGWAILTYDLSAYAGTEINIELSYDVRVTAAAAVAWQVNLDPNYPVAAGSTNTTLAANQWHSVTGSVRVTPTATNGNTLYLNRGDLETASAYFANFVLTITEVEAPPPITGGAIVLDYDVQWTVNEGDVAYICVYGWSRNPQASGAATLVEYYIIESLGSYNPGTNGGTLRGSATIDGKVYDFYEKTRTNQPSIEGNRTFLQYFSIRRNSRYTLNQQQTLTGTIDVSAHFLAWQAAGMQMGNDLYEVTLCVEAYANANAVTRGTANVRQNNLKLQGQSIASAGSGSLPNPHPIVNNLINNSGARYRGYDYEFWTDAASGNTGGNMRLNNTGGTFEVTWDNRNRNSNAYNILFRMGRRGGF